MSSELRLAALKFSRYNFIPLLDELAADSVKFRPVLPLIGCFNQPLR
jgi:hypothetical protein